MSGGRMSDSLRRWQCGRGPAAAVDQPQQRVGKLDGARTGTWCCGRQECTRLANGPTTVYTKIMETLVVREKPFLFADAEGLLLRSDSLADQKLGGLTWHGGSTPGISIPLVKFYVAQSGHRHGRDDERSVGWVGRNFLLTPGIYDLTGTDSLCDATG